MIGNASLLTYTDVLRRHLSTSPSLTPVEKLSRGEEEESEATQLMVEEGAPRQRASYARPTLPNLDPAAPVGGTAGGKKGDARGVYTTGADPVL
jgi:hypothetical protein